MATPYLVLRSQTPVTGQNKGSALTFSDADNNFQNLANATVNFTAGGTTSNIALNGALTIANSATVGAYISSGSLRMDFLPTYIAGISLIAGGTTTTGASGFTVSNTATVGASLASNTLSISLGTVGTAGTYQGAVTTDVYGRITSGSNGFTANVNANGQYIEFPIFNAYREKVAAHATTTGTISIDANVAPIQTITTTGNLTINASNLSNFASGESVTLLLRHNANNRIITSDLLFVNQTKTIGGHTSCVDAVTIFYDGTSYLASTVKYQA